MSLAIFSCSNFISVWKSEKNRHILCIFSPRLVQAYSTKVTGKISRDNRFLPDEYLTLARDTGYDYSYLSRYFKKSTGVSFNFYVNHYRLSTACYLMENTTMPIIRCAMDSGFVSLRSFNRSFKEYMGAAPSQYRRDHAGTE